MAETGMGIWYPNNYSLKADILADLKKMAESIDLPLMLHEGKINNLESDNTTNKANIADLIEYLVETALDLEEVRLSLVETQQHFVITDYTLDDLRIWDLEAGVYYLENFTGELYYKGATSQAFLNSADFALEGAILIVTDKKFGGTDGKAWMLLTNGRNWGGEYISNGFITLGLTTETDGTYYQYAINDLDNVKEAVNSLEHNVEFLDQKRTEQAEQIQALQQENSLLKEQVLVRTSKWRKHCIKR